MPLDDLPLDLTRPPAPEPPFEVMTRVVRLPTSSLRQARTIIRLQLDRLSPLPPDAVLFDLVPLRQDGSDTLFALGLLRRTALSLPGLSQQSTITAARTLDGAEVVFRFRNPGVTAQWETRWLAHAPRACLVALGVATMMLAGQIRADAWRERRLPDIAAEQRASTRGARDARDERQAHADWAALDRSDAATRLLCVASRVRAAAPDGLAVAGIAAKADQTVITLQGDLSAAMMNTLGRAPDPASPRTLVFPAEVCG